MAKVRTYFPQHINASAMHYGKQDYRRFRRNIKSLCLLSRELPHVRHSRAILPLSHDVVAPPDHDDESPESLRGLEHWLFDERTRNKRQALRSLLKYQGLLQSKPGMTRERRLAKLARASAMVSAWSAAVAVKTAQLDTRRAYGGE